MGGNICQEEVWLFYWTGLVLFRGAVFFTHSVHRVKADEWKHFDAYRNTLSGYES